MNQTIQNDFMIIKTGKLYIDYKPTNPHHIYYHRWITDWHVVSSTCRQSRHRCTSLPYLKFVSYAGRHTLAIHNTLKRCVVTACATYSRKKTASALFACTQKCVGSHVSNLSKRFAHKHIMEWSRVIVHAYYVTILYFIERLRIFFIFLF